MLAVALDPPFLDAFRIATSFENLFKAELLHFGYVVHKIDKHANNHRFRTLGIQQELRPIRITEIKRVDRSAWRRHGSFTIVSLTHQTLTLGLLTNARSGYKRSLRLSKQLLDPLNFVRKQRNTVHFLLNDTGRFNNQIVEWYLNLCTAMNKRLLPRYSQIIAKYPHLRGNSSLRLNKI